MKRSTKQLLLSTHHRPYGATESNFVCTDGRKFNNKTLLETDVTLEALADALAISELKDMLDYRLAKIKKDMEDRP